MSLLLHMPKNTFSAIYHSSIDTNDKTICIACELRNLHTNLYAIWFIKFHILVRKTNDSAFCFSLSLPNQSSQLYQINRRSSSLASQLLYSYIRLFNAINDNTQLYNQAEPLNGMSSNFFSLTQSKTY